MRQAALFLAIAFLAAAPARAQAVNPDASEAQPDGSGDALAAAQKRLTLNVQAGAEQGVDRSGSIVIPSGKGGIQINFGDQHKAEPATNLAPQGPNYLAFYVLAGAALLGLGIFLKGWKEARSAPAQAAPAPEAGSNLGSTNFAIVRAIGEGGMGVVYEAMDRTLDRRVAIKRLRNDSGSLPDREQLLKEAKTVAALHHPNIVAIHSIVSQGGDDYIVFEFVEGRTIEDILQERKRLNLAETRSILDPVCRALEFAHERGIIHRDLKPANVMLTTQGHVKVMDFGIARRMHAEDKPAVPALAPVQNFQLTHNIIGTPPYLAPEAESGIIRPEGDVFALGVMLYRMLSGLYPFPPPATVEQKMAGRYTALSMILRPLPAGMDALVTDSLQPNADLRLRTPKDFRERLAALAA